MHYQIKLTRSDLQDESSAALECKLNEVAALINLLDYTIFNSEKTDDTQRISFYLEDKEK